MKASNFDFVLHADDTHLHILGKKHKILEKVVRGQKVDHWDHANKLYSNDSKSSIMLMNNHNNINFSVSINHQPQQSISKYLGIILDKLSWKPQTEKLLTQLSESCGMLFKLKHCTNISVLKSVYFALFLSYLTYSMLNQGRTNWTTLLPVMRLQIKAVWTLKYDKTKSTVLKSQNFKHIWLI